MPFLWTSSSSLETRKTLQLTPMAKEMPSVKLDFPKQIIKFITKKINISINQTSFFFQNTLLIISQKKYSHYKIYYTLFIIKTNNLQFLRAVLLCIFKCISRTEKKHKNSRCKRSKVPPQIPKVSPRELLEKSIEKYKNLPTPFGSTIAENGKRHFTVCLWLNDLNLSKVTSFKITIIFQFVRQFYGKQCVHTWRVSAVDYQLFHRVPLLRKFLRIWRRLNFESIGKESK